SKGAARMTRFAAASETVRSLGEKLSGERFEVRLRTFADQVSPVDARELGSVPLKGQATDLAAAITSVLEPDRPQGQLIVLLSDGLPNASRAGDVLAAARQARWRAAAVYTRTSGGGAAGFALGIAARTPQELSYVGQPTSLVATITHPGIPAGHAS